MLIPPRGYGFDYLADGIEVILAVRLDKQTSSPMNPSVGLSLLNQSTKLATLSIHIPINCRNPFLKRNVFAYA